ncbi:MAG: ABC transporter permease [Kiloniellales bacterium]|nr:ABC transporter permease [Kiloniellales bacterium]
MAAVTDKDLDTAGPGALVTGFRRLAQNHLGLAGFVIVAIIVLSAIFADWIVPYDPIAMNLKDRMQGPSWSHLLGTDQLGRDTFSRVIMGGRVALQVALISIGVAVAIGLALGMIAGFGPRWLDHLIVLLFDTVRSFPTVMFALAVVALVGPSLETVMVVIIVTSIPVYGRVVRTQTLSIKNNEFIVAERAMGASSARILLVHVLPNVIGPLLILASMDIPGVIALEAGLSFLGLGVKPPTPSWGSLLNEGYSLIRNTPWLVIAGGIPLILTTLGFTFLGEALRDIFDPKLRKDL